MKLKAIETHYDGYRFRSRLEARWAVFFNALDIKYEYEIEGYDLGEAGWYLPDFWLPQFRIWAEVKPIELNDEEIDKCCALSIAGDSDCLQLVGAPRKKAYYKWSSYGDTLTIGNYRSIYPKGRVIHINEGWCGEEPVYLIPWHFNPGGIADMWCFANPDSPAAKEVGDTMFAVVAARSARF